MYIENHTGIFIIERNSSSRLPNKMTECLYNGANSKISVTDWNIQRAISVFDSPYEVTLCTTTNKSDDILQAISSNYKHVTCYRGSNENKLERLLGAAKTYDKYHIAFYDGDDLFTAPELLASSIDLLKLTNVDCVKAPKGIICGAFTYAFSIKGLQKMYDCSKIENTEMIEPLIEKANLSVLELPVLPIYLNNTMRFTLDYKEDLLFFNKSLLQCWIKPFDSLFKIINIIQDKKELLDINLFRMADFEQNQQRIIKEVYGE